MKRRLFASLLVIVMVLCFAPAKSLAYASTESKMQLGASGIKTDDEVYFGSYDGSVIPWTVLSSSALSETSVPSGANVLPLFSRNLLGHVQFHGTVFGHYSDSTLRTTMDTLFLAFPAQDQSAVVDATLSGGSMYSGQPDLANQKLFPLSLEETSVFDSTLNIAYDSERVARNWWLRTSSDDSNAYSISDVGSSYINTVRSDYAVRPALYLDQSSVLFISAASRGKALSGFGLSSIATGSVAKWKLTLYDKNRAGFSIKTTKYEPSSISIDYSGALTGTDEYLSAVIVDEGSVVYYGRLLQLDGSTHGASGHVSIDIPAGVTLDSNTTLRLFNEQYHNDSVESPILTDYSSALRSVTLSAEIPATGDSSTPVLWFGIAIAALIGLAGSAVLSRRAIRAHRA